MENLFGHIWCDCLGCDQRVEAFRILMVGRTNCDNDLMIVLTHFSHSDGGANPSPWDTTYTIFGEHYYLLHPSGEIQDPQLVDPDEDEDDDDDWNEDDGN